MDTELKSNAKEQDRNEEGTCHIHSPPLYSKGPKIATLITQYGLGSPYEVNKITQKIIRKCEETSLIHHLRMDTIENRLSYFNRSLFFLASLLKKKKEYFEIKKIILPICIGRGVVDDIWLKKYYIIITKFVYEMNFYGKKCYNLVKKSHFKTINNYVKNNCSDVAISILEDLKSAPWEDIDGRWYNELMHDKEVEILDFMKLENMYFTGTYTYKNGYDVPDTQSAYVLN